MAAATTIAVPCWSSWNTGIFMRLRHSRSTMKQSGALMSSRLMPPNVGSNAQITSTSFMRVDLVQLDVEHVDAGELLEQHRLAFHDRLRRERPDVAESEHRRAVRHDADQVAARGEARGVQRIGDDFLARERDARRIRQREVALVDHLLGRRNRDFAGGGELVIIERGFAEFGFGAIGRSGHEASG